MASSNDVRKFARKLAVQDTRLKAMERAAQTGFRSIEASETIDVYDNDGNLVSKVGVLDDGTVGQVDLVVTSPMPPTAPVGAPIVDGIALAWDGGYELEQPDGVTVAYVGVHPNQDPDDPEWLPSIETEIAQLPPTGGALNLPGDAGVETDVVLVAVTAAGVWSAPSEPVQVIPATPVTSAEIPVLSDGLPPAQSPTVTLFPGMKTMYVRVNVIPGNPDPQLYDLYINDELAQTGPQNWFAVVTLPNGDPLPVDADTEFHVVARELIDGAAAPGPPQSGRPNDIEIGDLAESVLETIQEAGDKADAAQEDADAAADVALAAVNAAVKAAESTALNLNSTFADWTGALPVGYALYAGQVVKETSIVKTPPNALRFNAVAFPTLLGVTFNAAMAGVPYSEYVFVEVDVYLVSGSFSGSGILLDWTGLTVPRVTWKFADSVPAPVTGKWYRLSKVLRKPTSGGTWTAFTGYLMGNAANNGPMTAKEIVFDRLAIRPATTEEIQSYNTPTEIAASADAVKEYVQSRGTNLVTNGTGKLGDNTNFSTFTYDPVDVPTGATGSFDTPSTAQVTRLSDELIPVDPTRAYELAYMMKQKSGTGRFYTGLSPYDSYGLGISTTYYMAQLGTLTTLAAPLNPGDTTITLASAANWNNTAGASTTLRGVIFWDYIDQGGKVWPENTYSRNVYSNVYPAGSIVGNVLTLTTPWTGPAKPAGTKLSNQMSGASYLYIAASNALGTPDWTRFSGTLGPGAHPSGTNASATNKLPMMTASVKLIYLVHYPTTTGTPKQSFANITLSEVTLALAASTAAAVADGKAVTADGKAVAAQTTANTKTKTFFQTAIPTSATIGDTWLDKDDQNKLYVAMSVGANEIKTGEWELARDGLLAVLSSSISDAFEEATAALTAAQAAQATADGAITTYYQATAPTDMTDDNLGDLWFNTGTNQASRWAGTVNGGWLLIQDNSIADALAAAQAAQSTADGKINAFFQDVEPTTGMSEGDLWYKTDDGNKPHYYDGADWQPIRDGAIAAAQATADSKGKVIIQSAAPAAADRLPQNLWIDTTPIGSPAAPGNIPKRWTGSAWDAVTDKVAVDAAAAAAAAQATATAAATAASTAQTTANGKNTNTFSTAATPPTTAGRVDGDVHSKLDGTKIVAQWVLTAGTWAVRTLDGATLTNLDAASITTGFLNVALLIQAGAISTDKLEAEFIEANEVYAQNGYFGNVTFDQMVGGALNAVISISTDGVINVGTRITIADPDSPDGKGGITIWADDAHTIALVRLHPDGSYFAGEIQAEEITVIDALKLLSAIYFSSGSTAVLQNGVADPTGRPTLTQGTRTSTWTTFPAPASQRGLVWDATAGCWWRLVFNASTNLVYAQSVTAAGVPGALLPLTLNNDGQFIQNVSGFAKVGNSFYVGAYAFSLADGELRWMISKCNATTGANQGVDYNFFLEYPAIGTDGTDLYAVDYNDGRIYRFLASDLSTTGSGTLGAGIGGAGRFIGIGDFGFGSSKLMVAAGTAVGVYNIAGFAWTGGTLTKDTAKSFTLDASLDLGGLGWKSSGTNPGFYTTHGDTKLHYWSNQYPATNERAYARYRDMNGTNGTKPSLETSILLAKRKWVSASLPPAPSGVTSAEIYVGYGTASPGSSMWKRTETITNRSILMTNGKVTSGTAIVLPGTNSLGGSPAVLKSEVGGFIVRGDGGGAWPDCDDIVAIRAMMGIRARGLANVTVVGPGGTATVAFPAGRFSSPPRVWPSKQGGGNAKFVPYASNITTTGCTIGVYSGDGSNGSGVTPVAWEAVLD